MDEIAVNLVIEDILSKAVLYRIIQYLPQSYTIGISYGYKGSGWIHKRIKGFNNAAKGMPYLVLTDLDQCECPPILLREWLGEVKHNNLLFRVAVKEVESWILASRQKFARFAGISQVKIPVKVDDIEKPKEFLVDLVKRSRNKDLRMDMVPRMGSTAKVGPDYNGRLISFINNYWDINEARKNSKSLDRTWKALSEFKPLR